MGFNGMVFAMEGILMLGERMLTGSGGKQFVLMKMQWHTCKSKCAIDDQGDDRNKCLCSAVQSALL
jgi:hypothetical protein